MRFHIDCNLQHWNSSRTSHWCCSWVRRYAIWQKGKSFSVPRRQTFFFSLLELPLILIAIFFAEKCCFVCLFFLFWKVKRKNQRVSFFKQSVCFQFFLSLHCWFSTFTNNVLDFGTDWCSRATFLKEFAFFLLFVGERKGNFICPQSSFAIWFSTFILLLFLEETTAISLAPKLVTLFWKTFIFVVC